MPKSPPHPLPRTIALLSLAALVGVTGLAAIATFLGWSQPLDLASHFQRQYFLVGLGLLVVLLLTRRPVPIAGGLLCVLWLSLRLLPWYVPSLPVADGEPLRLLWANLWAENRQFAALVSLIEQEQPDLVVLAEVNPAWAETLNSLRDRFPYTLALDGRSTAGIAVLSQVALGTPQIARTAAHPRPVIALQLSVNDRPLTIVTTHPLPPVRLQWFHWRNRQLADAADLVQQQTSPTVLVGDLNTTMWSPYYRRLATQTGLRNARRGFGILPSWTPLGAFGLPDRVLSLLSLPIDHCLVSPEIGVEGAHIGRAIGSDHLPLVVDLKIPHG